MSNIIRGFPLAIMSNDLVCMIDYYLDQPPPSLKCVPGDADHIMLELIFGFLVQISPSWMPNLGWASSCVIIFAHIVSLQYVFLMIACKSIVSSMWVHRDFPSLPAAMAVTSSVGDVFSDGGDFLSPEFKISASI